LGPSGERTVAASDFFQGVFTTALRSDELLVEVVVPLAPEGSGSAYEKFPHPASGYAVTGVAAHVGPDGVRVGITGASTIPYRARAVEQAVVANRMFDGVEAAAGLAADGVDLTEDLFASSAYRAHLVRVCTRRALERAAARAQV
jgi:carbon-monoxide dehydrogenase medium subunit